MSVKVVLFDMDGVLVSTPSSWVTVHRHFGVDNELNLERFWKGDIGEEEFVRSDVMLWKNVKPDVSSKDIEDILSSVPLMEGAVETVQRLRHMGVKCCIVSGGIDVLARRVAAQTGMDAFLANGLCADEHGILTGEGVVRVRIRDKSISASALLRSIGMDANEAIAVGDSITDIPLFRMCSAGVAFNTEDEAVRSAADYFIETLYSLPEIVEHAR